MASAQHSDHGVAGGAASYKSLFRILVVNDDGISAPGLHALLRGLVSHFPQASEKDLQEKKVKREEIKFVVRVSAPESEQSAASHCVTVRNPLFVEPVQLPGELEVLKAFKVTGSPADSVRMGLCTTIFTELEPSQPAESPSDPIVLGQDLPEGNSSSSKKHGKTAQWLPDLVLSGINRGNNAGINAIYSGTVAGAREGAVFGVPSVALSLNHPPSYPSRDDHWDFDLSAKLILPVLDQIVNDVIHQQVPHGIFFNVNIPNFRKPEELKGIKLTRQGYGTKWIEKYTEKERSHGQRRQFMLTGVPLCTDDERFDGGAMESNFISVTPMCLLNNPDESPYVKEAVPGWPVFSKL